jgi:outer membrane protein
MRHRPMRHRPALSRTLSFALATGAATTLLVAVPTRATASTPAATANAGAPGGPGDSGHWIVCLRALHLDSANQDSTGLGLSVNNKTFAELDISYFFNRHWAAELVLTHPQRHDIRSNGALIGSLKHLPPTLSLQYHLAASGWRPYVGAGINATLFSSTRFVPAVQTALNPSVGSSSFGLALGAGADVPLGGGWLLNLDAKKVQIRADIKSNGNPVGTLKVDPLLLSVGIGRRF